MKPIGTISSEKLSENEFSSEWCFTCMTIPTQCVSDLSETSLCEELSGLQIAMVRDLHWNSNAVLFSLFLYGSEGRSGSKITFSACFMRDDSLLYKISCSEECVKLKPTMKILEIPSLSGIFLNSKSYDSIQVKFVDEAINYRLKLKMKLHKGLASTSFCSNKTVSLGENNRAPAYEYPKELIRDLKCLFTSEHMCDLEIRIGENILRAHKLILGARSPVFKKMLERNCLESSSNSITITDCPAPPFEKFLKYLYSGELEDRALDTVMQLYSLGDKYDVRALQEACSIILLNKISSESVDDAANIVFDVLKLAECHNDSKLKDLAATFIVIHFPVVSTKQNWKDLMKSDFELTSNILALVLQKAQT